MLKTRDLKNLSFFQPDRNNWTPLTWACFLDIPNLIPLLVEKGAIIEHKDSYGVSCLSWAAGRGNAEVISLLLERMNIETINSPDKYGTTALLWACRKGHFDCASLLVSCGSDVNMSGMNGWTPLIASVCVNNQRLVDLILSCPTQIVQIDCVDKSGMSALMHAAKKGSVEITELLIEAKAFVNKVDQKGDSALIHAVKNDHKDVVNVLVSQGADVDLIGSEGKVSLMIAIEKNETEIASILIKEGDAKVNVRNTAGETCLIRATKKSNLKIVEMLLERGANVFETDLEGNTAVHIAVKAKMGAITQLLLSNPKHGRILYMPNKSGETPYNLDTSQNESHVLNQVFGARRFLPAEENETSHQLLGYHLYSASLADFFSEPSLPLPITLGLFARWGSGKSHFLPRLENDMKSFCQPLPVSHQSEKRWVLYLILLIFAAFIVLFGYFAPHGLAVKISIMCFGSFLFLLPVVVIELIRCCSRRFSGAHSAIDKIDNFLAYVHLLLCITFLRPPSNRGRKIQDGSEALPMRFLFSDRSRVADISEETGVAKLVASLCAEAELEYGFLAFRLLQASLKSNHGRQSKFKLTFCIPTYVHLILFVLLILTVGFLLMLGPNEFMIPCIALASVALFILLIHLPTIVRVCQSFHRSQYKRSLRLAEKFNSMPEGKFIQQLKQNVESLANIVIGIDQFAMRSTRMVVFLDGLDRCEQDKLMKIIEMVTILFCYPGMPFIVVYCLDPVSIIKSIEQRINTQIINQNIKSYEYMRTIVHLPFYFPDKSRDNYFLEAMKGLVSSSFMHSQDMLAVERSPARAISSRAVNSNSQRLFIQRDYSHVSGHNNALYHSCVLSTWNLSKMLTSDRDCLHDLNPKEMQRLINIISVTGRLLRAYKISFDWKKLAFWVHLTEKWSYHTSWILFYLLKNSWKFRLTTTIRDVFEDLKLTLPPVKSDKMFENDSERRFLELFLTNHHPQITLSDVRNFYPHTVNLDPSLKTYIDALPSESTTDLRAEACQTENLVTSGDSGVPSTSSALVTTSNAVRESNWHSSGGYLSTINSVNLNAGGTVGEEHNRDIRVTRSPRIPSSTQLQNSGRNRHLTDYSLDDVCNVLSSEIEGIDSARLYDYRTVLRSQNINGKVLAVCDMEELKCYLHMTFGDWNLFKQWVYTKRMLDSEEESETTATSRSLNGDENHVLNLPDGLPTSTTNDDSFDGRDYRTAVSPSEDLQSEQTGIANQETEHVSFITATGADARREIVESRSSRTSNSTHIGSFFANAASPNYTAYSESTVSPQEAQELRSHNPNQLILRQPTSEVVTSVVHSQISLIPLSSPVVTPSRFTITAANIEIEPVKEPPVLKLSSKWEKEKEASISDIFQQDFLNKQTKTNQEPTRKSMLSSKNCRPVSEIESRRHSNVLITRRSQSTGRRCSLIHSGYEFGNLQQNGKRSNAKSTTYLRMSPSLDADLSLHALETSFKSNDSVIEKVKRSISINSILSTNSSNPSSSPRKRRSMRTRFESDKLPFCVQETEQFQSKAEAMSSKRGDKEQNRKSCMPNILSGANHNTDSSYV